MWSCAFVCVCVCARARACSCALVSSSAVRQCSSDPCRLRARSAGRARPDHAAPGRRDSRACHGTAPSTVLRCPPPATSIWRGERPIRPGPDQGHRLRRPSRARIAARRGFRSDPGAAQSDRVVLTAASESGHRSGLRVAVGARVEGPAVHVSLLAALHVSLLANTVVMTVMMGPAVRPGKNRVSACKQRQVDCVVKDRWAGYPQLWVCCERVACSGMTVGKVGVFPNE